VAKVEYADGDEASPFAQMLGELIKANVEGRTEKRRDFESLEARVGIRVRDIGESVTLDFRGGRLVVHNGLKPKRAITITADSDTVMQLSLLRIGPFGMPVYVDSTGRDVVRKLLSGKLKIDGMLGNIFSLNAVTRLFSVQ
jgi:SCP-2 sterol transfer family